MDTLARYWTQRLIYLEGQKSEVRCGREPLRKNIILSQYATVFYSQNPQLWLHAQQSKQSSRPPQFLLPSAGDVMTKLRRRRRRRRRRLSPFPIFQPPPIRAALLPTAFFWGGKERAPRGGLNWAYSGIPPHLLSLEGKEPAEMKRERFFLLGVGNSRLDERGTTYKPRFSSRM